jgi:hypothetical protein
MKYKLKLITPLFCGLIAYTPNAYPAAWTKEKGNLELITSYAFSTNKPKAFLTEDYQNEKSYYDKQEYKLYSEYGVTNNLTAGLAIEHNTIRIGNDIKFKSNIENEEYPTDKMQSFFKQIGITEAEFNLLSPNNKKVIYDSFLANEAKTKTKEKDAFMKIFVRQKLFQNKNITISFQPTFQFPLTKKDDISEKINYINTKKSLELMFSLGSSFEYKNINSIFNQYHFTNLNLGYKKVFDNFYDEINIEFAGGIRINQTSFMLFEIFRTYNNQSPSKYGLNNPFKKADREYSKNEGELVKELSPENNHFLRSENTQIKLSSITQFSNLVSFQIGISGTRTKYDDSYGIEISLWFNL